MGTRSLTKFYQSLGSKNDVPFAVIYRQYDGYPDVHGRELAEFLVSHRLINGIGPEDNSSNAANGMGCLAAQVVCHLKTGEIGNIYLTDARFHNEDYNYDVWPAGETYTLTVRRFDTVIFNGSPHEFLNRLDKGFDSKEVDE